MHKRALFYLVSLIILAAGSRLVVMVMFGFQSPDRQFLLTAICLLLAMAMLWVAKRLSYQFWIVAGLLLLAALFLPARVLVRVIPNDSPEPFGSSLLLSLFLLLSLALVITAVLFASSLALFGSQQETAAAPGGARADSSKTAVFLLVLSALLLAKSLHSAYQYALWDSTTDSLGIICLSGPFLAIIFAGILALVALPGKMKLLGFLFALIVPLSLIGVSAYAQSIDIRQLTEIRAARISAALEAYYGANGRYPDDLNALAPRYILTLPEPGVIFAQPWCYQGGDDYALGYVTRDHWSDPRLYARLLYSANRAGDAADALCTEGIAALMARDPHYYELLSVE